MKLSEIHIRDPFILPFEGKYYLFGTPGKYAWKGAGGFWCYLSDDLENWSEPIKCFEAPKGFWATENYWAPEVHYYNGRFYMFASFSAKGHMRAVQILSADKPQGPYEVWSCPLTPNDWMCLDGPFLYKSNDGKLLMIWSSFGDNGYLEAIAYSEDGTISGKWKHCEKALSAINGGHGMIFKTFNGYPIFTMHYPNTPYGDERPLLIRINEISDEPYLQIV